MISSVEISEVLSQCLVGISNVVKEVELIDVEFAEEELDDFDKVEELQWDAF